MLSDNEKWLLSFYRTSEISGSLFFGRIARGLRPGPIQVDMTKHFADEAQHAWFWTSCLKDLGAEPFRLAGSYQDQYVSACGLPANIMEVLAVTLVFERRVVNQYGRHKRVPGLHPRIVQTLDTIMSDEEWHIQWVREALRSLEPEFGAADIEATLTRFRDADEEVYANTMREHEERITDLMGDFSAPIKVPV